MNYLILGASAGLGRSLSRKLASEGNNLILLATDDRDLQSTASDITIRYHVKVETIAADVSVHIGFLDDLEKIINIMGGIDGIFCPIGSIKPDDYIRHDPSVLNHINNVNYISVVAVITRFWDSLIRQSHQTVIVGFGSVACIRGRNFNVCYSAAKRALLSFFESLRHAGASSNVLVQFYILGYLDTNLAFGKQTLLPRASTETLARRIFENLRNDLGVAYYPRYWYLINLALRVIPWTIFKRLTF
jgi:short-subunit dehydrogenase